MMKFSFSLIFVVTQWITFLVVLVESRSVPFIPSASILSASGQSAPSSSQSLSSELSSQLLIRGGSTAVDEDEDDEDESDTENTENSSSSSIRDDPEFEALQSYRLKQQLLMQLRSAYLSESLAQRGIPLATLDDVRTPEGAAPPQPMDWDCALSTPESPKPCLYSFDTEPNTKVIAPIDTEDWISLGALNRLRRRDASKVDPMWHSKYALVDSWFHPESKYSLLQHVGTQGFMLNTLLECLPLALGVTMTILIIVAMPILEYVANRIAVSGFVWIRWLKWYKFVHAALPLKLLLGQMAYKGVAVAFKKLLSIVKNQLVDLECQILEQKIPLTVGVPTITKASFEESDFVVIDSDEEDITSVLEEYGDGNDESGDESIEEDDDEYDAEDLDEDF